MNIKAISLRNFRGFRDARIELKPLTVLIGSNSAGKSSFGQALAALAHVHRTYASTPQASLTPPPNDKVEDWPVDLGTTSDLRTEGAKGPVKIELETINGLVELGFGGMHHNDGLFLSYAALPSGEQSSPGKSHQQAISSVPKGQISGVVPIEGTFHEISATTDIKQVIKIQKINERTWQEDTTEVSVIIDGLIVKAVQHMTGTSRRLSNAASDDVRSLLEKLTYLRANRKRPSRGYRDGSHRYQPIGYSGEWAPSILFEKGAEHVTYLEPPVIPNSVDEAKKNEIEWKTKKSTLNAALVDWLGRFELASHVEVNQSGASKDLHVRVAPKGQTPHDITEIGFGVSQVIPVLVAGLLQPEDSLLIVDLPEAHLHPRPQSSIADFFCSLALSGRTALVETHSEMFFHRLRLRAAQDPSLMDKIAVYFIDAPKDGVCSSPRLVGLRQEDYLRWPEGFLQEAWEMETQIKAVRKARDSKL